MDQTRMLIAELTTILTPDPDPNPNTDSTQTPNSSNECFERVDTNEKDILIHNVSVNIPVVSVAITSTRHRLTHQKLIRSQQISRKNYNSLNLTGTVQENEKLSVHNKADTVKLIDNYAIVDAFGLSLKSDCIHLDANSAIRFVILILLIFTALSTSCNL
jgi:hypothetical protein